MITDQFKALATAKAKLIKLEASLREDLATLPERFGFADYKSFLRAVETEFHKWRQRQPRRGRGRPFATGSKVVKSRVAVGPGQKPAGRVRRTSKV